VSVFRSLLCEVPGRQATNLKMPKTIEQWLLFKYIDGEFTPLSKPFKTKEQAEKARSKYAERERKTIGIGLIRAKT
jgi:hypothetical protein